MANKKQSLAIKYRPRVFSDVSEQGSIKVILENQIKNNIVKHAYLFCGGAGTGKTTTARIVAKMINQGEGNPIELDCASNNGVDDMRAIQDECRTRPLVGKYKIFILDECHMITQQGWNSMLKILEEPPEYVVFLFCTTDPQKIIGTILSRVQRFNFQRISTIGIINRLRYIIEQENKDYELAGDNTRINYEEPAIEYIARLAKGGMRDSITTLEKCLDYNTNLTLANVHLITSGGVTEEVLLKLLKLLLDKNGKEALLHFNDIYMSGIDTALLLRLFTEFLQNCVKYLITTSPNIVSISDITIRWLTENANFVESIRNLLLTAIHIKNDYSSEDLKILIESWIIQECNS